MEDWKRRARDRLRDYPLQRAALANLPDEIARLESEATSIRSASSDSTPVQGGGSTREDRLLSNITARTELAEALRRAGLYVAMVDRALEALDEPERRVLDVMYMHRTKGYIDRLMDELDLTEAKSVYRVADKCLYKFTLALYGVTES